MAVHIFLVPLRNNSDFDPNKLMELGSIFAKFFFERKMFDRAYNRCQFNIRDQLPFTNTPKQRNIHFQLGIDPADEISKAYIFKSFELFLAETNLDVFLKVYQEAHITKDGGVPFSLDELYQKPTHNGKLLRIAGVNEQELPFEMVCPISGDVIDNAVYLKGNPKVRYNKHHLKIWLFRNPTDPTTRAPVNTAYDIVPDTEFTNEIRKIVRNLIFERKLKVIFDLPDLSQDSLNKGLIKSITATHSDVGNFGFFAFHYFLKHANVNYVEPVTGSTALHYAAKSESPTDFAHLISQGASVFALDGDGKSPLYYADIQKRNGIFNAKFSINSPERPNVIKRRYSV